MILQALKEYYDRKAGDPTSGIAAPGFERKAIPYLIVIDRNGRLVNLEPTGEQQGRRLVAKMFVVPRSEPRAGPSSHEKTFLLWDHYGYLLDHSEKLGNRDRAHLQHKTWLASLQTLPDDIKQDPGVAAVLKLYEQDGIRAVKAHPNWPACAAIRNCNLTFKLAGDLDPVPCRPAVREHVRNTARLPVRDTDEASDDGKKVIGRCLVTGEVDELARIHGHMPMGRDSRSLVGIQTHCGYDSYGKERGYNAPVGKKAEFAYVTALNTLLKSERNRMQVGDAVTLFWTAKQDAFEDFFGDLWSDDPDRNTPAVESLFKSPQTGAFFTDNDATRFYVLGLAPLAKGRITVRFWIADTVANMAGRIRQHFEDTKIVHGPRDRDGLSLDRLLRSTALQEERDNIPPNLGGDTMRAILEGLPYPQTLLQAAIRRARAEKGKVTYARAALIKACVNRETRRDKKDKEEELAVSLDERNTNIGYRLGRLFAALEKIQQEANPGINATIRDRFYGAASSTPVTVFGNLMRLKNHHLAKLEHAGRRVCFEKLLGQIMDGVSDFPPHLALADQGRFAIGYYHQTQKFFEKKAGTTNKEAVQ